MNLTNFSSTLALVQEAIARGYADQFVAMAGLDSIGELIMWAIEYDAERASLN